jgi:membrane fusion protein (multidrug efflux system)
VESVPVKDVAPIETYVGQVQPIQTVKIVARVPAYLEKVDFKEGGAVTQGQLLFELEKAPYEAAVLQAQGSLSHAQATQANAEKNLERDIGAGEAAITREQIQHDRAARDEAEGQVTAAKGSLQAAELNLSYCTIKSPIAGRIGRAQVTQGNLVGPTTGTLATVVQTDPIRVFFDIPDDQLAAMEQQTGESSQQFMAAQTLTLTLPDGKSYRPPGEIEFLNNQVDTATGTLTAWGRFKNGEDQLIPGSYVTVSMRTSQPKKSPLVPIESVQNDAKGEFVLVVDKDNKVREQRVALGKQIGQSFIVNSGLTGGERVITEGVQKVHPGEQVAPAASTPATATHVSGATASIAPEGD